MFNLYLIRLANCLDTNTVNTSIVTNSKWQYQLEENLESAFEIQVLSTSSIKFKILQVASAMPQQKKNCRRLSRKLCILGRQQLGHAFWFFNSWDYLIYLNYVFLYNTLNGWNRRHLYYLFIYLFIYLLLLITLFCFLCVSVIAGECIGR